MHIIELSYPDIVQSMETLYSTKRLEISFDVVGSQANLQF